MTGRQTPYKRIDLAVAACNELKVPLVVIGNGPEHRRLEKLAQRNVTFLTNVSDTEMVNHLQTALAFIFPTNTEDFGIAGVEAMAAGTPVVAYGKGGPLDYVIPGKTGFLFNKLRVDSVVKAIEAVQAKNFNYEAITEHANTFSVDMFKKNMKTIIKEIVTKKEA